jgi:hypothetical protein
MGMKPVVYIASPYTKGDCVINTRCSIEAFLHLIEGGECVPISPLALSFLPHMIQPLPYETWMEYMLSLVENCDAVLRINAVYGGDYFQDQSPGADREVALAVERGIPVFFSIEDLEDWLTQ